MTQVAKAYYDHEAWSDGKCIQGNGLKGFPVDSAVGNAFIRYYGFFGSLTGMEANRYSLNLMTTIKLLLDPLERDHQIFHPVYTWKWPQKK